MNPPIPFSQNLKIKLVKASITDLHTDAVVNAANKGLQPGAGVCGAIYLAAGPQLEECTNQIQFCEVSQSVITPGFNSNFTYIIHAVGPDCRTVENNNKEVLLQNTYLNVLSLAKKHKIKSIAFPCISCGIYKYPIEEAAEIAFETILKSDYEGEIIFCCFGSHDYHIYDELKRYYKC